MQNKHGGTTCGLKSLDPDHERKGLRYASDLTGEEWDLIEPHMLPPQALGRPRTTDLREVVNAILYVLRSGCP